MRKFQCARALALRWSSLFGRQGAAGSASQSEAMTLAVGSSPRGGCAKTGRRGATLEGLDWFVRSGVAPRRASFPDLYWAQAQYGFTVEIARTGQRGRRPVQPHRLRPGDAQRAARSSLSLRERVRVRVKRHHHPNTPGFTHVSPSPRPSPAGRGGIHSSLGWRYESL